MDAHSREEIWLFCVFCNFSVLWSLKPNIRISKWCASEFVIWCHVYCAFTLNYILHCYFILELYKLKFDSWYFDTRFGFSELLISKMPISIFSQSAITNFEILTSCLDYKLIYIFLRKSNCPQIVPMLYIFEYLSLFIICASLLDQVMHK